MEVSGADKSMRDGVEGEGCGEGVRGDVHSVCLRREEEDVGRDDCETLVYAGEEKPVLEREEFVEADTVEKLSDDIRILIDSVVSKKQLWDSSASFMRDHLRTLLARSKRIAEMELQTKEAERKLPLLNSLEDETCLHILNFLDGQDLFTVGTVSRRWHALSRNYELRKRKCLERCRSLETDEALWRLLGFDSSLEPAYVSVYPTLACAPVWKFALHKPGKFVCNLVAHVVNNSSIAKKTILPTKLTVERRFDQNYLDKFAKSETCTLYFEPETRKDVEGYNTFVQYLIQRKRAGLAITDHLHYIFIPPCAQAKKQLNYDGTALTGLILPSQAILLDWLHDRPNLSGDRHIQFNPDLS